MFLKKALFMSSLVPLNLWRPYKCVWDTTRLSLNSLSFKNSRPVIRCLCKSSDITGRFDIGL